MFKLGESYDCTACLNLVNLTIALHVKTNEVASGLARFLPDEKWNVIWCNKLQLFYFFLMIRAFPFKHTFPPKDPYGWFRSIDEQELFNLLSLGLYHNDLHLFSFGPLFFLLGFQGGSPYNKPTQTPLPISLGMYTKMK